MIVVQRVDGTWYRTSRPATSPLLYTKAWYGKYLQATGLPLWFLRPAHLSMLVDDLESQHFETSNAPTNTLTASSDYLTRMYGTEPSYITPRIFGPDVFPFNSGTSKRGTLCVWPVAFRLSQPLALSLHVSLSFLAVMYNCIQ